MPVATPRPPLRRLLALSAVFFALGAASVVAQPFSAVLAGGNEVPPVETDASGAVLATLDGTDLTLTGSFAGLTGDYAASHIHVAPAGANGPVVVGLNPAVGGDGRSGTFDETVTLSAADVEALENGELYVNVHSAAFGSGEIRGQLLGAVQINELRTDQPGSDDDEYAELTGPPGTALDGYTYLVIGDSGAGGSGVIEFVLDLAGQTIPDDGLFLLAEDDDTFGAEADLITALNFENGESVTHVLVQGFSGSDGQDLDTDDDGGLEDSPWTTAVDAVGFVDDVDDFAYGAQLGFEDLGPVGAFPPAHAYRDGETGDWIIGEFDPAESADTPGAPNPALGEVPVVFFTEEFGAVIEGESAEFFVEIDYPGAPDGVPATVAVAFAPDESTADASDFTYAPESVTFSGDTDNEQVAVTLMAVPDEAVEGEETANFILSVIEGAATVAPPGAIGITIQDATEGGTARLQVIHNAPDPAVQVVDVYVDGVLLLDDLAFRTGTAFLDVPAGVPLEVAVAPGDSGDAGDAVFTETYTLDADAAVQLVAVGVLDPSGFEPNPAGIDIGFTLLVAPDAREEGSPGLVDVRGVHGTPDAPVIDL
ncbi:MAG: CHRD domain-containing protein, partial [Rhodothermales bacterium]|nr:CHRD domain-containing protein [Rhodothermales bacterium]